jgi:hypothetical protein
VHGSREGKRNVATRTLVNKDEDEQEEKVEDEGIRIGGVGSGTGRRDFNLFS